MFTEYSSFRIDLYVICNIIIIIGFSYIIFLSVRFIRYQEKKIFISLMYAKN